MVLLSVVAFLFLLKQSAAVVCHFDASCTCTSAPPHLGQVECLNTRVSLSRLNASRLFSFSLVNNQIDFLPPSLFEGTGLYRFHMSQNSIYQLNEDVFSGVERSLWELHLTYCKLSTIPYKSIRHLQKLKTLNLTGNLISAISSDQLRGVAASLQALILADNRLSALPDGVFAVLRSLEVLSLRGNALLTLEPAAFTPPPPRLISLDLSDNNIKFLSYKQLSSMRMLSVLDVSFNLLTTLPNTSESARLMLDSLLLDFNNITELESYSFVNFGAINKTSFRGNPLISLEANAFRPCKIEELYLTDCQLTNITPEAFDGLDDSLKILDLSGNNISTFKFPIIQKFSGLTSLRLDHNKLEDYGWLQPPEKKPLNYFQLLELSILGRKNTPVALQSFPRLPHLHTLAISHIPSTTLDAEQLVNFSVELETLKIEQGTITSLNGGIFKHVRGIKTLDLTDNNIDNIDVHAFTEVAHSLERVILTHALTSKLGAFPFGLFKPLSSVTVLKLNHNFLRKLPTDLRWVTSLETFYAHDNILDYLPSGLFDGNAHKKLKEVVLSFNKIPKIPTGSFSDLVCLETVDLSENDVAVVEAGAFRNLPAVKRISFRGNKIFVLKDEAFQNLPHLEHLDLSYNSLQYLGMSSLDQVGTLSAMTVNASYNAISGLKGSVGPGGETYSVYGTIKVLDFSHNNISIIEKEYLAPVQGSLSQLILSHNIIRNISRDMLPQMPQLQYLDLSYNKQVDIEFDALRGFPMLQTFLVSGNKIKELPTGLFSSSTHLECLDFSHNSLYALTDSLITTTSSIFVDVSHNSLSKVPLASFSPSTAANVRELLLRSNKITKLPSLEAFARFSGLRHLDLSYNKLTELGNSLGSLPCLTKLSLSYNRIRFDAKDWRGQERSLKHLDLSNTSLSYVPALPLPSLLSLKLAYNGIAYVPPDLQTNLTDLKMLDVSHNIISEMTSFPQVVALNLAFNPITSISNSTFEYFTNLADLDIRQLPLTNFDMDSLDQLELMTLALSNYRQVEQFNVPLWINENLALKHLVYEVAGSPSMGMEVQGQYPDKIGHVTLRGQELKSIPSNFLQGFKRPQMLLTLQNTSVESLEPNLFSSSYLRNISLELTSTLLKSVANPSNVGRPNVPHSVFLTDIRLTSHSLDCDCKLGWIETWGRKRREREPSNYHSDDLRSSTCKNRKGKSLMYTLRTDLECGWSGGAQRCGTFGLILIALLLLKNIL